MGSALARCGLGASDTAPQVTTVGLDEAAAVRSGFHPDARTLALEHVPRALVNFEIRSGIKLMADAR